MYLLEQVIVILDEPTAALDYNIYKEYAAISQGILSVFISHRISFAQFCDKIIFLKNGKITEQGTHKELMQKQSLLVDNFPILRET